jgi:hypothetical protein
MQHDMQHSFALSSFLWTSRLGDHRLSGCMCQHMPASPLPLPTSPPPTIPTRPLSLARAQPSQSRLTRGTPSRASIRHRSQPCRADPPSKSRCRPRSKRSGRSGKQRKCAARPKHSCSACLKQQRSTAARHRLTAAHLRRQAAAQPPRQHRLRTLARGGPGSFGRRTTCRAARSAMHRTRRSPLAHTRSGHGQGGLASATTGGRHRSRTR